jgi:hypothetical protein
MLTKDEFIRHILGEAASTKECGTKKDTGHIAGFDFADDAPDSEARQDTRFVTPLLQAGFGEGQGIPRATVIRSTDSVSKYIPDEVRYWPKTPTRPHQTLLIEARLTHRELLAIPAFKSRQLAHLDIAEDAVARLVAEALEGFQRGAEGLHASALKGRKDETLCVVSIVDEREGHAGRLACFGTFNAKTEGLETFFLTEHARTWDRADARERLGLIYERQFKKLGEASWQEAFTTTDERKQAEKLLEVCTKKNVAEKDVQESILDLLDTIARGFGLRKKADAERRLRAFPLPGEHDIGIDSEEREKEYGGTNPFSGVTLRDDHSRLLGYIVYPLKTKAQAEKLRQHLEKHNRFHNVLVVYPDANQASIELWQGREQLTGKLRKGQSHKDAADVVNLLSRFFVVSKAKVRNPAELAQELAYRARYLRRLALRQLEDEPEKGPLRNLYNAFKVALVHDQKEDEFADAFAQTITYGLLTARWLGNEHVVATGERFTRQSALKHLPAASPFLNDLFKSALSLKLDEQRGRLLWLVDDVADLLDRIDVTYVFGAGDKGSDAATDPVIHFYEPFLAAYDSKQKIQRGVFFTPRPVVSYIVRSVHELLQKEFGLEDGLASTDTWGDVAKRIKGLKIPDGTKPSDPFVCVLDPATGTGTFLYECIEVIERTMKERWCRELGTSSWQDDRVVVRWNQYVANHLLPRLYGFELMMASYSVAHLKLSFKLAETGYSIKGTDRLHIYLTNTLEPASASANPRLANLFVTLANEAQQVSAIKEKERFSVVIGNPPYSVSSWNTSPWITGLTEDYKRTVRAEESQIQALSNDYIKFLRFGQWVIEQAGVGLVGMITGHGYTQGTQPRDMRKELSSTFDRSYYLDLHGSIRRSGTGDNDDEPVFQIMTGVAIVVALRKPHQPKAEDDAIGLTTQSSLTGPLTKKFEVLSASTVSSLHEASAWHQPSAPYFYFAPPETAEGVVAEYQGQGFYDLPACFGTGIRQADKEVYWATGFSSRQDDLAIAFTEDELSKSIELLATSKSMQALQEQRAVCTTKHWDYDLARIFANSKKWKEKITRVAYRPFDFRWTVADRRIVPELREQVMSQLGVSKRHIGLISSRAVNDLSFAHCFVTDMPVDKIFISSKTSTNAYVFPLFIDSEDMYGKHSRPNFSRGFIDALAQRLGIEKKDKNTGLPRGVTAEDAFHYLYAVLQSPGYRSRFGEFLKQDFPRIPLPGNAAIFRALAEKGAELVDLHLLRSSSLDKSRPSFVGSNSVEVEKVSFANDCVWIDKRQTAGFKGIDERTWKFYIGGYQVCEKWLKDRKGRTLSKPEIGHYQRIVVSLRETERAMGDIDSVISKHGGWPGAFATKASAP